MINRNLPPEYTTDFSLKLEPLQTNLLTNGIEVSHLNSEAIDVFRIDFVFPFGLLHAPDFASSVFLNRLITKGTKTKNAAEIAEGFESLGGFFSVQQSNFHTTFTLYGLSNYFEAYLPLILEVIEEADFPQEEIELAKRQALQAYQVDAKKTSVVGNIHFKENIYGPDSLLGQSLNPDNIGQISRTALIDFHHGRIKNNRFKIYLCGNIPQNYFQSVDEIFGRRNIVDVAQEVEFPSFVAPTKGEFPIEGSVQSTVMLGKRLFNRKHPDFFKFLVTNTLLGGYFGSRLMKNIREEKGLTYGISSSLRSNHLDGIFRIVAELNKEKVTEAIEEIYKEIEILKSVPVSEEELITVKNYIKGSIIENTNTLFDIMDKHIVIAKEGLGEDFYEKLMVETGWVTPNDIMEMTRKYLNHFTEIIAG